MEPAVISNRLTPAQLDLVKRTVASDCNNTEFDLFIEVARQLKLNPFRRQIYAVVYSKDDPAKRKMSIIVGIDGYRSVANDCGDYRPSDKPTEFLFDESLKSSENPAGLVKATVTVYKFGPDKQWHPVVGEAYWSEFAPIKDKGDEDAYEWVEQTDTEGRPLVHESGPKKGKPKWKKRLKSGAATKRVPDGKWESMPTLMLAKCAEAQALRRGWPQLSGVYIEEEMQRADLDDLTASEQAEAARVEQRLERIAGTDTIMLQWLPNEPLQQVPLGKFADLVLSRCEMAETPAEIDAWMATNKQPLHEFWARAANDSLALRTEIDKIKERLAAKDK